jgi:hypothetical protein
VDVARRTLIERRRSHRFVTPAHGVKSARIRGGHDAWVVNLATGGACIDTARRLLPGARIDITLVRDDGATLHDCRVLRCAIVGLAADAIAFRAAVQFTRALTWFAASAIVVESLSGHAVRDAEAWLTHDSRRSSRVHERPGNDEA